MDTSASAQSSIIASTQLDSVSHPLYAVVLEKLREAFQERNAITGISDTYELLAITVQKEAWIPVITLLKEDPDLKFQFLTTLCGVHYPDSTPPILGLVAHLHSFTHNVRIRLKTMTVDLVNPRFPTLTTLFAAANWMERETYDFFGIVFEGHPNLKRILNEDTMTYFPMRKEYPLEDATRDDKDNPMFGRQP